MSKRHVAIRRRDWLCLRRAVFERARWRCQRCGRPGRLECDHVRPLWKGGAAVDLANLQALCRRCHIVKSREDRGTEADPAREEWRRYLETL